MAATPTPARPPHFMRHDGVFVGTEDGMETGVETDGRWIRTREQSQLLGFWARSKQRFSFYKASLIFRNELIQSEIVKAKSLNFLVSN